MAYMLIVFLVHTCSIIFIPQTCETLPTARSSKERRKKGGQGKEKRGSLKEKRKGKERGMGKKGGYTDEQLPVMFRLWFSPQMFVIMLRGNHTWGCINSQITGN